MTDDPSTSSNRIKTVCGIAFTLLATAAGLTYLWHAQREDLPGPLAGDDAHLLDFMHASRAREAREWLAGNPARSIAGLSREQSARFIDRLYEIGAKRVIAYGGQMSLTVIVELPDGAAPRKMLFDWHNSHNSGPLAPAARDVGQRYLLVGLKL